MNLANLMILVHLVILVNLYSDSLESSDSDQHKAKIFQLNLDIVSKSIGVGAPELLDGIVFRILSLLVKFFSLQP